MMAVRRRARQTVSNKRTFLRKRTIGLLIGHSRCWPQTEIEDQDQDSNDRIDDDDEEDSIFSL